eukprot:2447975-Ditylum_brightwellii.AAC.1
MNKYHVMGAFLDPLQTNKLCASMDNKLGELEANDLWTDAIDGNLKDLFQKLQAMQDLDAKSDDEHKVVCVGQDKEDRCGMGPGSKKQKLVFDNLDDEEDDTIIQTKSEIDKF